ncbi:extracellular calcium-sensing receptor-like [Lissotriton helveticus]
MRDHVKVANIGNIMKFESDTRSEVVAKNSTFGLSLFFGSQKSPVGYVNVNRILWHSLGARTNEQKQHRRIELERGTCHLVTVLKLQTMKTHRYNHGSSNKIFLTHVIMLLCLWEMASAATAKDPATQCGLSTPTMQSYYKDGNVTIGILAAVHLETIIPSTNLLLTEPPASRRCQNIYTEFYQCVLAMVFAISEINRSPELLADTTLGFQIYDSCSSELGAIGGTLQHLSGGKKTIPNYDCHLSPKLAGFLGDGLTVGALPMARILGVSRIPQISYGAGLPILSDKDQFPSFLRTVAGTSFQVEAILQILLHFRWAWIGILASNNDFGLQGSQMLKEEAVRNGICIEIFETLPTQASRAALARVIDIIQSSTAKVIVCYAFAVHMTPFLNEISRQRIAPKIWIGVTSWIPSPVFSQTGLWQILNGTLALTLERGEIPGFKEFLYSINPWVDSEDIFLKSFWEQVFSCKWPENFIEPNFGNMTYLKGLCTGREKLQLLDTSVFEVNYFLFPYNAYKATYALAQALHNLLHCKPQDGPFTNRSCADPKDFQPWQMLHYVKNVHMKISAGSEILFDSNGDTPPLYDVLYWHMTSSDSSSFVKVGTYNGQAPQGLKLVINKSAILWGGKHTQVPLSVCSESCSTGYRKSTITGRPKCCFTCLLCPDGSIANQTDSLECMNCPDDHWSSNEKDRCIRKKIDFLSYKEPLGLILAIISVFLFLNATVILCIFIKYQHTAVVRANNLNLSYILLVSLMLCFLCSLIFIGLPSRVTCMVRQVIFGISFSTAVSCVMAKTVTVVIAFRATKPNSNLRRWIGTRTSLSIVLTATFIELSLGVIWQWTWPSFPELNNSFNSWKIEAECNEGSIQMFYCMLAFMGFLACVSFGIAFLARNLPDTFNEAKFITFSMLVFVSVWLSFIPAYLSTKGKYLVATEIFAILSSGAGVLYCIFAPKIYIVFLKPEKNTKNLGHKH